MGPKKKLSEMDPSLRVSQIILLILRIFEGIFYKLSENKVREGLFLIG